jgi:Fe-S cluster assembly protein SufD
MVKVSDKSRGIERHLEKFDRFEKKLGAPQWVFPLRKAGIARFAELGFPTTQDEDWRFTSVAPIAKLPFRPILDTAGEPVTADTLSSLPLFNLPATRLVFLNGHYAPELSPVGDLPPGVTVTSLAAALNAGRPELETHLARYARQEKQPFTALNTAFFQDGAFISVADGVVLDTPIHLVFITSATESGATTNPRVLLLAGKQSKITLIEQYWGEGSTSYFTNAVVEIVAEDEACVEHCKFQDEGPGAFHIAALHVQAGRASNVISHSISFGARLARNNIRTVLAGEGLECTLNGLYITRQDQLADHHMVVEHAKPHCASHEYFNGILDGKSKGVFHGRILVRRDAQKTDAKQTNKNLLLSDTATVDTKPQLEIYADDVKCTHGATIGQLNEEGIFYLRARGISKETATRMLIHAFAGEIIERIRHEALREQMDRLVWNRLEANPHVAETREKAPAA